MASCPNKSHPDWQALVNQVGEYTAMAMYRKNGSNTPNIQRDLKLPKKAETGAEIQEGISNTQWISALKRLKAYNTKLGTAHRLKNSQLGESTMYTYEIIQNWKSELYKADPVNNNTNDQLELFQLSSEEAVSKNIGDSNLSGHTRLENSMKSFLQSIGVDIESVEGITDANGNPISAVAKADMLNKVVQVVENKAGIDTLPEEAAHFFVRLLRVNEHPLYNSLQSEIRDYEIFEEVRNEYDDVYDSNIDAIEEEAIGKLISKVLIAKAEGTEAPEKIARAQRWFDKVLAFLRKLIGKPSENPFTSAALSLMNRDKSSLQLSIQQNMNFDLKGGLTNLYQTEDNNVRPDVERVSDTLNEFDDTNQRFSTKKKVPLENLEGQAEFAKWMVSENGLVERYWDSVNKKIVANRATDRPGAAFVRRVGRERAEEINANRDNEIKRTGGTALHSTMERLIQLQMNNHGDRASILRESGVNEEIFKRLEGSVRNILTASKQQQLKINPNGVFHIRPEQMVHDADGKKGVTSQDTAGSIDLVVLYSDNSVDVYDYKFVTPKNDFISGYGKGAKLILNPFGAKMDGYHMQLATYKDILTRKYGVSKIRKSRIVPFHVEYKAKKVDGVYRLTNEISNIQTANENEFLKQIPVANEMFGDAGIDRLITKFSARRNKLAKERRKIKADPERYEKLSSEIMSLDSAVQNLRVGGGIGELFLAAAGKMQLLNKKRGVEQEFLEDGSVNPDYMTWSELNDMTESFNLYSGIVSNMTNMLQDLKTSDPASHAKLLKMRNTYSAPIEASLQILNDMRTQRIAADAQTRGIQDATRATRDMGMLESLFNTSSEFEHPIFRVAWNLIEQAQINTLKDLNSLEKEVQEKADSLKEWAKANGMSLMDAYKLMVNEETSNLEPMYTKEFWEKLKNARSGKDVNWMKQHYQQREGYQEQFNKWKERRFKKIEEDYADIYEEDISGNRIKNESGGFVLLKNREKMRENMKQTWLNTHDLSRNSAWLNSRAYLHLEIKPEMEGQYHSEKYKYILENQPLLDFYTMYQQKNKEFSERTGHHIAGNFIANLRMDAIDAIGQGHTSKSISAALDSFKVHANESDEINGVRNPVTGELEPQIPLLYLNQLQDSEGNIDNSLKSLDLSRSLYLMGKSVFNYEQKNAIEDQILSLKEFLLNHEVLLTDYAGNLKRDASGQLSKKESDERAVNIFERLYINQALYGQNIQDKEFALGNISGKKLLLNAKSGFGAKVLGLAVIPAVAAWGAGRFALNAVAKKGTFFTSKMSSDASKMFIRQDDTYNFLVNHFEVQVDNKSHRIANQLSASLLAKTVNMDTLFLGFRKADEWNENNILVAMSQNYGVDENGMPKRLEQLPEGSMSIKEIADKAAENAKDNKEFDMKLSEKGFAKFRGIVRAVAGDVKGQTSVEDGNAANTYLVGNLMMQFKNWMPRILRERVGNFRYRSATDTYEQGRYRVVADEFRTEENLQKILKAGLKTGFSIAADAITFGLGHKASPDVATTQRLFEKYKQDNPENTEIQQMSLKDFTSMRRGQLRAAASELRSILGLFAAMLALSLKGSDDEEMYKKTWATRQLYNSLRRTSTELGFTSNPGEFVNLTRSTIPLSGLLVDTTKALSNTADVFYEDLTGIEDKRDKTGRFYYTGPFIPGFKQMRRLLELTEQDKRPYQQ